MRPCLTILDRLRPPLPALGVVGVVLIGLACQDDLTAPGACPDFCPPGELVVIDTVLPGSVTADSTFRGYVPGHRARAIQLAFDSAPMSYGVARFGRFSDSLPTATGIGPVVTNDSFRVHLTVRERSAGDTLTIVLHRLPPSVDSLTELADVEPYFQDSTVIGTIAVPDSIPGDSVRTVIPGDAFPEFFGTDSAVVTLGLALRGPEPAFISLGTFESDQDPILTRFVQVRTEDDSTTSASEERLTAFETHLAPATPPLPDSLLAVGGLPAARTLFRVVLPSPIMDSSDVVRATLVLVPAAPVIGAPLDTLGLRVDLLMKDLGPKSPVQFIQTNLGAAQAPIGSADTLRIDVTPHIREFQRDTTRPRSLSLRVAQEAARIGEVRVFSSRSAAGVPLLHLTYVPLGRAVRR